MNQKPKISLETLKSNGLKNPMVQDAYFSDLEKQILKKTTESPLELLKKENSFTVPELYFENLEQNLIQIPCPEANLLNNVGRQQIFSVPEKYFENLPYLVREQIRKKETSIWDRFKIPEFGLVPQLSLAALVFIVLSIGLLLNNNNSKIDLESNLSKVSVEEIGNYLAENDENYLIEETAVKNHIEVNVLSSNSIEKLELENLEISDEDLEEIGIENLK